MNTSVTILERLAILGASVLLSVGLIAVLSGFFAGRDQAGVTGTTSSAVQQLPDLGRTHLRPGQPHPRYNSDPPSSGAHVPRPVSRQAAPLSNDQLLEALELGDVVIAYGASRPPAPLVRLVEQVSGRFTPALAAVGQAVILTPRAGTRGVVGLAWARVLRTDSAADPQLLQFAEQWLGRGAPGG